MARNQSKKKTEAVDLTGQISDVALDKLNAIKEAREAQKERKVVNKTVTRCKLLCAKLNAAGDKMGIALLNYAAELDHGQLDCVSMENPVLVKWVDITEVPAVLDLATLPVYSDIACTVSGEGEFVQLHDILTEKQYADYRALLGG